MNIVFLLRYWPVFGGGEKVTSLLANKFVDTGHNVFVLYLWERSRSDISFIDKRIKQICISDISEPDEYHNINKTDFQKLKKTLTNLIQETDINIVINQWWPSKLVYKAIKCSNIKQIKCHHTNVFQHISRRSMKHNLFHRIFGNTGYKFLLKLMYLNDLKYSDRWILLSELFLDEAKLLFSPAIAEKKIRVISNPLPYSYILSKDDIKGKEKIVLYVGRIDGNKRINYIIDAWSKLEKELELCDWRLLIVGEGVDLPKIKEYSYKLKCQRIFFEGWQNPQEYYFRAAILVMTSINEGWPMVLAEAQQHGCVPVVMDSFVTLHDIIIDNVNGKIIKNNDIEEFSNTIKMLMNNEEQRFSLAYSGLETCMRFSIDNIMRSWDNLFSEFKV